MITNNNQLPALIQVLVVHNRLFRILLISGLVANKIPIVMIPAINKIHNTPKRRLNFLKAAL